MPNSCRLKLPLLYPEEVLQFHCSCWTITTRKKKLKELATKSGMTKSRLCWAAKLCLAIKASLCSSVSAGYIPGRQTLHGQWKKICMQQGCLSKFIRIFPLKKSLFFLFITSSSKQVTFSYVQVLEQTQPLSEQRGKPHSHTDATTSWYSYARHPDCLWMDLFWNFSTHVIQFLSNCTWNNVVLTEWGSSSLHSWNHRR